MNAKEKTIMDKLNITSSTDTVFHYKKYSYKNLKDAVNYATIDMNRRVVKIHSKNSNPRE